MWWLATTVSSSYLVISAQTEGALSAAGLEYLAWYEPGEPSIKLQHADENGLSWPVVLALRIR